MKHSNWVDRNSETKPRTPEEMDIARAEALGTLSVNPTLYRGFDEELKADPRIAETYLGSNGYRITDLPMHLQTQPHYAIIALQQNPRAIYRLTLPVLQNGKVQAQIKELKHSNGQLYTQNDIDVLIEQRKHDMGHAPGFSR